MWYLDNGCSEHTTEDKTKFSSITLKSKGCVTYGDNMRGGIIGIDKVGTPPFTKIDDVLYVEGLSHNLINIR